MFNRNVETISLDPVVKTCQEIFGIPYPFPWQRLIIAGVLDVLQPQALKDSTVEPLRQIAVLPTGAGKSLCWMIPAVMISGLTIAVFPLLSLISDQKRRLDAKGIDSMVLKGGQSPSERRRIWDSLESGQVHILLANPEVLQTSAVSKRLKALDPFFLVVDETHTVSQWGESFRPACAGLGRLVAEWNPPAVLALTATAGPDIRNRLTELLFNGHPPSQALADPDRPSIRYGVIPTLSRFHVLERLARWEERPLIVFGSTRPSVEQAARILRYRLRDPNIKFYHAGLTPNEKSRLEKWFMESSDGILCATCAYGMGVDKSDIRTVIHLSPTNSVEAYLQESGRASRDGKGAKAWLIWTPEDAKGLSDRPDASVQNNIKQSMEGASTANLASLRLAAMLRYATSTKQCRREMLLESLGIEAQDCNGCDICSGDAWKASPEEEIILKVVRWNSGHFRKGKLGRILIGRRNLEIRRNRLDMVRGFGMLSGWELEDAEEALEVLIHTRRLKYSRVNKKKQLICNPRHLR